MILASCLKRWGKNRKEVGVAVVVVLRLAIRGRDPL
jgi:hypothetical protein